MSSTFNLFPQRYEKRKDAVDERLVSKREEEPRTWQEVVSSLSFWFTVNCIICWLCRIQYRSFRRSSPQDGSRQKGMNDEAGKFLGYGPADTVTYPSTSQVPSYFKVGVVSYQPTQLG